MFKKLFVVVLLFGMSLAQDRLEYSEFRLGSLSPADADAGLYLSASSGKMFDANLGYNFEIGLYTSSYQKQERTPNPNQNAGDIISIPFEQSTTYLPVLVKFNFVDELNERFLFKSDIGVGYGFLWNGETNYVTDTDESYFFSGFIYQLGADVGMQISSTGSIYLGVMYNGGELKGDSREIAGLPTFNVKDMSGLGYRLTVRIDGLGLF